MDDGAPRVLVVDDEPDFVDDFRYFLQGKGLSIQTATSVGEALDLIFSQPFHLILLDLKMPTATGSGLGGLEILQAMRRRQQQTPVVVITSHTSQRIEREVARLGAFDRLYKPIDETDLRTVVDRALAGIRERDQPPAIAICPVLPHTQCSKQEEIAADYSPRRVFVNVPASDAYEDRAMILRKLLAVHNQEPVFADEAVGTGLVLCHTCRAIQTSRYALTDVSLGDPDVMYALGLMQAVGLFPLLLKHHDETMPRHLLGLTCQEYRNLREFRMAVERWLETKQTET